MTELDIEITTGPVRAVPVVLLSASRRLISGPCRLHGWTFREALGNPSAIVTQPDAATAAIAPAAGSNVSLPAGASLTGFDIDLSVVGTGNMMITVTNVPNGPYTYDLAAGQSRLSVSYPTPLPPTGGAPNVAWSATAAATGSVTVAGATFTGGTGASAEVEISSGSNPIGEASMGPGGVHNAYYGVPGIFVPQDITVTPIIGTITGAVYLSYQRELP